MTAPNPLVLSNATRFRPLALRAHSRSPSRSPIRKAEFTAHELDPLLGNLSPESTLQAFSATEVPSTRGKKDQDGLYSSIANASTAERALGIKAALAAQKVRQWLVEISSWHWPDPKASALGAGFVPHTGSGSGGRNTAPQDEGPYMGSLKANTVRAYKARIEEVKDGLEALDVEDLKEHVLDAHIPSRSRPGTRNGLAEALPSGSEYSRLDDLTAVITATILQTLPYLAELNMLISTWDVRIAVLFEVPELVQKLNTTRVAVEEALKEVRTERSTSFYTQPYVDSTKERLQTGVSFLGVRFDRALDLLEGHEDALPDSWIEEMDTVESNFGDWVVEAERMATKNQLKQQHGQPPAARSSDQTARDLAPYSFAAAAGQTILSTDSHAMGDHSAQNEVDELPSSAKPDLLPEHPALVAFKHRPVRKASVRHSAVDADGRSADLFPGSPDSVDEEDQALATMATGEQATVTALPTDSREPCGRSLPRETTSDLSAVSCSPQQQARLADLVSLNHVTAAEEYAGGLVGSDGHNAPPSTADKNVQAEPFSFPPPEPKPGQELSTQKRPLKLELPPTRHRRETSEVSVADSAFSEAYSDISNAEIVDARTTHVLASPKISVVESPFRASRDSLSAFAGKEKPRIQSMHILGKDMPSAEPVIEGHKRSKSLTLTAMSVQARADEASDSLRQGSVNGGEVHDDEFSRPLIVHRASIASIEVIPKGLVRRVDSGRKSSYDRNLVSPIEPHDSPANARKALTPGGSVRSVSSAGTERTGTPTPADRSTRDHLAGYQPQPVHPSSSTDAVTRPRVGTWDAAVSSSSPGPHQLSKGQSSDGAGAVVPPDLEPSPTSDTDVAPASLPSTFSPFENKHHKSPLSPDKSLPSEETLEAKIKDILVNLPTRIRLTSDSDSSASPAHPSSSDSTRSSTPAPSLTLSPARQDRSSRRYNAGNSEVRVYHLIRNGQPRDTPPTKLHVRLVGENGERVMVRVGGGWADLAEYLREYSLHHGKRTIQEGRLEVANLPASGPKAGDPAGPSPTGPSLGVAKTRSAPRPDAGHEFGALPSLTVGKARRAVTGPPSTERKHWRPPSPPLVAAPPVQPPPVPVIPASFRDDLPPPTTTSSSTVPNAPTVAMAVPSRGPSFSASTFGPPRTPLPAYPGPTQNFGAAPPPIITTTSALSPPVSAGSSPTYTPLGAAGPKGGIKSAKTRATTFGSPAVSSPENEAWVQGMIGKARRVSAQNRASPATPPTGSTNHTAMTFVSTPASRRVSAAADAALTSTPPSAKRSSALDPSSTPTTPTSGRGTPTSSPSPATREASGEGSAKKPRSKSVTGIRRVFLRSSKKSDKAG